MKTILLAVACAGALGAGAAFDPDESVDSSTPGPRPSAATVTVRVRDARGVPVPDARVVLGPSVITGFLDDDPVTATPRGEGRYDARLPGGGWRVVVAAAGAAGERTFHVSPGGRAVVHVTVR